MGSHNGLGPQHPCPSCAGGSDRAGVVRPAAAVPLRGRELRRVPGVLPAPPWAPPASQARLRLGPALGEGREGVRPDPPLRGVPARTGIGTAALTLIATAPVSGDAGSPGD